MVMSGIEYDEQIPYFVYGTLRPGHGNSPCWENWDATARADGEVVVDGFAMYASGIPYAIPEREASIVGCLIIPPDDVYAANGMRRSMDSLEGHPHAYERRLVEYRRVDETQPAGQAWIYVYGHGRRGQRVDSGDYNIYCSERYTANSS